MKWAIPIAALLVFLPNALPAQQLQLKREPPKIAWPGCPPAARPAAVPRAQRQEAERLAKDATEASILGDNTAALALLVRATARDPASDRIAYRLARTLEALDRRKEAVAAYCRYLALAPDAADAPEARGRLTGLTDPGGFAVPAAVVEAFNGAIAYYDAGRLADAEAALTAVIGAAPAFGDALYDRGVVRLALGVEDAGTADLQRYLELHPGSSDFADVLRVLRATGKVVAPYNPSSALATGLLVPGLGQFTTGRPVRGLVVLGGAATALTAGVLLQNTRVDCLAPPVHGKCANEYVLRRSTERPYLVPAIGAAAVLSVLGAIDAFVGAKQRNEHATELLRVGDRDGSGTAVRLGPSVDTDSNGTRLSLIRFTF
jgi:tetratricopeptide (TPR) repeat protein